MGYRLSPGAAALGYIISGLVFAPSLAFAHGGQTVDNDRGAGLLWVYVIALAGIVAFIVFRFYLRSTRPQEPRRLIRRLKELDAALTSNLATLRDAEDYPSECGLSAKERQSRLDAVAAIRRLIAEEKLKPVPAQNDAQSAAT